MKSWMKSCMIVLAVLLLASPAMAVTVETNMGAMIGHGMGDPAEESFNLVWGGPVVKSWNDGDTKLSTLLRWGMYEEASVDGLGFTAILSDVMWKSVDGVREVRVLFNVGFMDKYRERTDGGREVAPTVGGGLSLQISKVISLDGYVEGYHKGPDVWKAVGYVGLSASTAFSIG
ncbi:MAG: hypothetical protein ABIH23_13630, partial [bacterium]